jgi:arginyl-tRNA--protein-N-Asp/Glu arginylyltransferase
VVSSGDRKGEAQRARRHSLLAWLDANELPRTPPHPCPYLPDRVARERAFLAERLDGDSYHELMDRGFRRSGSMFYATDCPGCRACVPLRVPVATFRPTKSQRRAWRRNADVTVAARAPQYEPETFALYRRYLAHQHAGREQPDDEAGFREAFFAPVVDSVEVRYLLGGRLVAWSLLDVCARSLSSVYHCFDPEHARRSLGVYSVLAEIAWARDLGVPWYYLGFWIEGARTMRYKADYGPHETLHEGQWCAR